MGSCGRAQNSIFRRRVERDCVSECAKPINLNSLVYRHFKPILKRAGLPRISLYDLRHTTATLALTVEVSRWE